MAKKATKKNVSKKVVKHHPGRPKGSKNITTDDIIILSKSVISRKEGMPGIKRLTLATTNADNALRLERLASLLNKQDPTFISMITPTELKRARKKKLTKA